MNDTDPDPVGKFATALVEEIWAQMGREGVRSVRALAAKIDMNHVSLNDRLGKKRTPISTQELYRICSALHVQPWEIVRRAGVAAGSPPSGDDVAATAGRIVAEARRRVAEGAEEAQESTGTNEGRLHG